MIGGTVLIDLTTSAEKWVPDEGRHGVAAVLDVAPAGVPVKVLVGDKWAPGSPDDIGSFNEHWINLAARHPVTVEGTAVAVRKWVAFLRACEELAA